MNKEKLSELIHLYLSDELEEQEKSDLEKIIKTSREAAEEFESMKSLYKVFTSNKPRLFNEEILLEARRDLLRNIRKERMKPSFKENLFSLIGSIQLAGYKLAAAGVFTLAAGVFAGYLFFNSNIDDITAKKGNAVNIDEVLASGATLANIRLADSYVPGGKVTITFEAARPYQYTGEIEDLTAQKLLANLITKSENPGFKIQTVNSIAERIKDNFLPDDEIKNALIASLKTDNNAGVRRAALDVLKKYPFDAKMRDVFLFILEHDNNPGIRIAAINTLAELKLDGIKMDSTVRTVLDKKTKTEPNLFVRKMAESLLIGEELK